MSETGDVTGTKDKNYNLLWFTEACLSNALRLEQYIADAERDGDTELAEGLLLVFCQFQAQSRKTGIQGLSHFFHSKLLIRHSHYRLSQPGFRRRDRRG